MVDKNRQKNENFRDFSRQTLRQNKNFRKLKRAYAALKSKYADAAEILHRKELFIPDFIFSKKLSSSEAISKYMVENCGLSIKQASLLLKRTNKNIWYAYNSSKKKLDKFEEKRVKLAIPTAIFQNSNLSVLENIVAYLKDESSLAYSQIARMLHRDDRTVWAVYNKTSKKKIKLSADIRKHKEISDLFVSFHNLAKKFSPGIILKELEKEPFIPVDIFSKKLGCLESIIKFLVENYGISCSEIAHLLNRPYASIWNSYSKSREKMPERFVIESRILIPASVFHDTRLGALESIVAYLHDVRGFSFHEISALVARDERTLWTSYQNKKKKMGENEIR